MARSTGMILAVILAMGTVSAQDLSTEVYPSEDELLEALQRGEIDQERYEVLLEILREGIDSSTVHLFEEIPGLIGRPADSGDSRLSAEQAEAFTGQKTPGRPLVRFDYRYAAEVERDGRGLYRTTVSIFPTPRWSASVRLDRSLSGRERVTGRYVRYRAPRGTVREAVIGTFSRRLGLGTVAGYRGRVLEPAETIGSESALFPDYGGSNGGYVRLVNGAWQSEGMVSLSRDDQFRLLTVAAIAGRMVGRVKLNALAGYNRLENRATSQGLSDVKLGAHAEYRGNADALAIEATGQLGEQDSFGALVFGGAHRRQRMRVQYRGWYYDNDYLDLSGGSKTGAISVADSLEEAGFVLRTRRTGSTGGWLKTSAPIHHRVVFESGGVVSIFSEDTLRAELLAGLVGDIGKRMQLRADILSRLTRRRDTAGEEDDMLRRVRLEGRYDNARAAVRVAVGHTAEEDDDYWSLFGRARWRTAQRGHFELWTNLGRVSMHHGTIDYSYSYLRFGQVLRPGIEGALKVAHRYRRSSDPAHITTVALEVEAEI